MINKFYLVNILSACLLNYAIFEKIETHFFRIMSDPNLIINSALALVPISVVFDECVKANWIASLSCDIYNAQPTKRTFSKISGIS